MCRLSLAYAGCRLHGYWSGWWSLDFFDNLGDAFEN
jgi:hypothetical protein